MENGPRLDTGDSSLLRYAPPPEDGPLNGESLLQLALELSEIQRQVDKLNIIVVRLAKKHLSQKLSK